MECGISEQLIGCDIHGFRTFQELGFFNILDDAQKRWLRPNEIHAILSNSKYFSINVRPLHMPKSGTIVLFDRKMLRNFRKDGHNWRKKKDGRTVKEAHEHLKIGNEERIHVYYAHGQDHPTFVRRCYWLLDKDLEHIVLVHYRETKDVSPNTSKATSGNSVSCQVTPLIFSQDHNSNTAAAYSICNRMLTDHETCLQEINTLTWDDLVSDDPNPIMVDGDPYFNASETIQQDIHEPFGLLHDNDFDHQADSANWMDYLVDATSVANRTELGSSPSSDFCSFSSSVVDQHSSNSERSFIITDISSTCAISSETTKIIITGTFSEKFLHLGMSNLMCICDQACIVAEIIQAGAYRFSIPPHSPGCVDLYLSIDGHNPISEVINFEYLPVINQLPSSLSLQSWNEFVIQTRLVFLLSSTSRSPDFLSGLPPKTLLEANNFAKKTCFSADWERFFMSIQDNQVSFAQAKCDLFELALRNMLKEWLLQHVIDGRRTTVFDTHGQAVIHLCAILGYTWSIDLFSSSGLSLDLRDKFGWTALHWAAYCGREKMVAVLLSAGAKPYLVTDPTPKNSGGCTAADLASAKGYDGLAAYLSENALVGHLEDMSLAGNTSDSLHVTKESTCYENVNEGDQCLKDVLAGYRRAADAAAHIHAAFREHTLKVRMKTAEFLRPKDDARSTIAAMKIQHAFRNFGVRKKMDAAAHIQYRYRTWKTRQNFLNVRQHAIRIQAAFRGFQIRKLYLQIVWSVGVLEKAILRWRLKRKGLRGLHLHVEPLPETHPLSYPEEDFYITSRKLAEERMERLVVRIQAIFRSKKAQEEYRRMKLAHYQAKMEYQKLTDANSCHLRQ